MRLIGFPFLGAGESKSMIEVPALAPGKGPLPASKQRKASHVETGKHASPGLFLLRKSLMASREPCSKRPPTDTINL